MRFEKSIDIDAPRGRGHEAGSRIDLSTAEGRAKVARRVAIAIGAFVVAWVAVALVARWLFGSGNILVWVFAALVGATVYVAILRRDRRVG